MPGKRRDDAAIRVGGRIRTLRAAREWSAEKLADRAGMSANYLGMVERGVKSPTLGMLEKIARGLGVGLDELFEVTAADPTLTKARRKQLHEVVDRASAEQVELLQRMAAQLGL